MLLYTSPVNVTYPLFNGGARLCCEPNDIIPDFPLARGVAREGGNASVVEPGIGRIWARYRPEHRAGSTEVLNILMIFDGTGRGNMRA